MSRRLKWFLRTMLGLCVIAALALLIISAILPVLARRNVERVLHDLGVRRSTFTIRDASFSGIRLNNVQLGESTWLDAADVKINYSAASLSQARVTDLTITNATYRIAYHDGNFDFGFDPQPSESAESDLPLSSVTLHDCVVVLDLPQASIQLHVDGTVVRNDVGRLTVDLEVRSGDAISFDHQQLEIDGFRARLPLNIAMSHNEIAISALAGETVNASIDSLVANFARMTRAEVSIAQVEAQPLIRAAWGERGAGLWMNATTTGSKPVQFSANAMEGEIHRLTASFSYSAPEFQQPQISGAVHIPDARMIVPQALLEFNGISLVAPYAINSQTADRGNFRVENMVWLDHVWPAIEGSLSLNDDNVQASAQWSPIRDAAVAADLSLTIDDGGLQGDIIAQAPRFTWQDDSILAALFPDAGDPRLGGEFSANARLRFIDGKLTPHLEMQAYNASLAGDEWPVSLESFSGVFAINGFSPLRSPSDQHVEIHRAMISQTPVTDGAITFSLESDRRISVREGNWSMGDLGRFRTSAFTFDPSSPHITTDISCTKVGLEAWLKLLTEDRIKGQGQLSGKIALTINPMGREQEKFTIREGYLYAEPAGGWIRTDDSEVISRIVEEGTAALSGDERLGQVRDRLVAALQDYQYTMLRLHFIPEDEGLLCRVTSKGQGRRGPHAQEIESLTINLHGFDTAIRAALAGKSIWDLTD